jgi:PKHD-type hydroxylase
MNLTNYYWYFKSALPPLLCDNIIKYALAHSDKIGTTGDFENKILDNENLKEQKQIRDSNLVWLNDNWIYKELHPYIHLANQLAGWNFEWDRSESIQFTKYKLNQFYHWHCDSFTKPYDCPGKPEHGKIRKLSAVISLSDDDEYEGGDFQFDFRNSDKGKNVKSVTEFRKKGSVIVFPSFIYHRVTPVTKGTRYSLVTWNLGYPYV